MRLAIISDIHGNLEALTAVLARIERERVDEIVCLGDTVGYGPDPGPCIDLVRSTCRVAVLGNHDEWAITSPRYDAVPEAVWQSILWTAPRMNDGQLAYLASLPLVAHGDRLMFVHSSPVRPHGWSYILDEVSAARNFSAVKEGICFVGHSHFPGIYPSGDPPEERRYIVNVGSVGQPRDGDPRACFVIYDSTRLDDKRITIMRVDYDSSPTQEKIRATDLPQYFAYRLSVGR